MQTGTVIGNATSTIKHPSLSRWKMLVVQLYGADGATPDGEPVVAVDALGAGRGEKVILSSDGQTTRELLDSDTSPVRWSVIGIQD